MLNRKTLKTLAIVLSAISGIFMFQNCGGIGSSHRSKNSFSVLHNLEERKIWSLNRIFVSTKPMIFYVNPTIFDPAAHFGWFYELNGNASNCAVATHEDYTNAVEITCSAPGVLNITLHAVDPEFNVEEVHLNLEVENASEYSDLSDEVVYLTSKELVLNLDGTPGPAYIENPVPVDPNIDGATLYSMYNCAFCHGPLSNSEVKGFSAQDIRSAITGGRGQSAQVSMGSLNFLTDDQLRKIADALK